MKQVSSLLAANIKTSKTKNCYVTHKFEEGREIAWSGKGITIINIIIINNTTTHLNSANIMTKEKYLWK